MDIAVETLQGGFILSLLASLWIVVVIIAEICTKVMHIQKLVHDIRENRSLLRPPIRQDSPSAEFKERSE